MTELATLPRLDTGDVAELEYARWVRRYEWHLDQIPAILHTLRDEAIPLKAARLDTVRVSGSRDHSPLPFRAEMVDDADDLWAALTLYLGEVADLLGETVTDAVSWTRRGEPVGIGAAVRGRQANALTFQIIAWLIDHAARITAFEQLQDTEEHLFGMIRRLRARYMVAEVDRPTRRRDCSICGQRAVTATWTTDVNDRPVLAVACRHCGATYDEPGAA